MSKEIYFSVIMPTLNSESTIEKSLISIRSQNFDQDQVEIIVADGGSVDKTKEIAQKYSCRILHNEQVQPESAKYIGITNAKGKVCLFLDSDEVLKDKESFKKRKDIFENFQDAKVILFGGYEKPEGESSLNDYINYYSDPFSFFVSKTSTEHKVIHSVWKNNFKDFSEEDSYIKFRLKDSDYLPPVDMCAGNCFLREYYLDLVGEEIKDQMIVAEIFYRIVKDTGCFYMLKDSPTIHNSSVGLGQYIKKLNWRIINNVHYKNVPGTGFSNREEFQPKGSSLKKYLFIPFALTIIGPLIVSIYMALKYKKPILLLNFPLTIYVAFYISYQYIRLIFGRKSALKPYGK